MVYVLLKVRIVSFEKKVVMLVKMLSGINRINVIIGKSYRISVVVFV